MTAPLVAADAPALARVLARAFAHDPYMRHVLPDDRHRAAVLPMVLGASVRYGLRYGQVDALPGLDGGAVWLPPGATPIRVRRMARVRGLAVPWRVGPGGFRRMSRHDAFAERLQQRDQPAPYWYLWVLGVEPERACQGLGTLLLQPGLARADADGVPACLKTENERNLSTYRRSGFEVVHAATGPGGLRFWTMRRDPQPPLHPRRADQARTSTESAPLPALGPERRAVEPRRRGRTRRGKEGAREPDVGIEQGRSTPLPDAALCLGLRTADRAAVLVEHR